VSYKKALRRELFLFSKRSLLVSPIRFVSLIISDFDLQRQGPEACIDLLEEIEDQYMVEWAMIVTSQLPHE